MDTGKIKMFYYRKGKTISYAKRTFEIVYNLSSVENDLAIKGVLVEDGKSENIQDAIDFFNKNTDISLIISKIESEDVTTLLKGLGKNLTSLDCWTDIGDYSALEYCENLTSVRFDLADGIKKIWDTSKNPKLNELILYNAKNLTDISRLENSSIEKLIISGVHIAYADVTDYPKISNIYPIKTLKNLKHLEYFTAPNPPLEKKDLVLLASIPTLEFMRLSRNYFTFNQFAWLKSKNAKLEKLDASYYYLYQRWDETEWYAIIGKEMPEWIQDTPENNLRVYFKTFEDLVELYSDQILPPED